MVKVCSVCNIEKPLEDFHNKQRGHLGKSELCKLCKKEKDDKRWENFTQEEKDRRNRIARETYHRNRSIDPTYRKEDKDSTRIRKMNYRMSNELVRMKESIRSRIVKYLKKNGYDKKGKTFEIVGTTPEILKEHIGQQFEIGMSWSNHGEWHIDHIIPLSSAKNETELYKLFHYTNLQPLWSFDNLSKGSKII
jgi:hypothetical protein